MRTDNPPRPAADRRGGPPPRGARCPDCGGTGFRVARDPATGRSRAGPCTCTRADRAKALLRRARIPSRYAACEFGSFFTGPEFHPSVEKACQATMDFVKGYSARKVREDEEFGLLLLGPPGVGKTHLAVAALRELILDQGVEGRFADFRDLIKSLQASYDPNTPDSESEVLRPLIQAEVLVLDDLGAARMKEWLRDMIGYIVNNRYNERKVTIITSNKSDAAAKQDSDDPVLTNIIGPAVRSRLHEMCVVVEMEGADHRLRMKRSVRDYLRKR